MIKNINLSQLVNKIILLSLMSFLEEYLTVVKKIVVDYSREKESLISLIQYLL